MSPWMHIANILNVVSFLVKDILWLRLLSMSAGAATLMMLLARVDPQWIAACWTSIFMLINGVQAARLVHERRPLRLTGDEQHLYQLVFRAFTPPEYRGIAALGGWERVPSDGAVVRAGEPLQRMLVLVRGRAHVRKGERVLTELAAGQFVGEMAFVSDEIPTVDVIAAEDALFFSWKTPELRAHLAAHPEARAQVQGLLGADLARKLRGAGPPRTSVHSG